MPAVLVHGVPETSALWDELVPHLDRDDVVALQLPGFGTARPDGFGATKEEYVAWLIGELETLQADGPIDLVGHDWGGGFVVRVVSTRADLVRSWISDAAGLGDIEFEWHDFAKIWQTPEEGEAFWAQQLATPTEERAGVFELFGLSHESAVELAGMVDERMAGCILPLYRSAMDVGKEWAPDFHDIAKPGLVLAATEDAFLSLDRARVGADRAGARFEVLEGVGHWWMLQDPATAAGIIKDFWGVVLISPFYDRAPVIEIDGAPDDVAAAFVRQRARLDDTLASFTDDQWRTPSRCDGWSAEDVIAHLVGTNQFWGVSIASGLKGEPTRYLGVGFDPKATPAQMVDAMQSLSPAETYAEFHESNTSLLALAESLDVSGWSTIAEAPPGHLPIRLVAHHALWDAWVHERDILLPLGIAPVEDDDEVLACLRYGVALGPAFGLAKDAGARGTLVADVTDPTERIVATVGDGVVRVSTGDDAGDAVLAGPAVEVLEMLSIRTPFPPVAEAGRWLVAGLAEVFEAA